jgi:hypothetical protein
MNVNTKNCTPIFGAPHEVMIRPNLYILQPHRGDNIGDNNNNNTHSHVGGICETLKVTMVDAPIKKRANSDQTSIRPHMVDPSLHTTSLKKSNKTEEALDRRQVLTPTVNSASLVSMLGVPKKSTKTREEEDEEEGWNLGRQVKYLPTILYTPIQTSARHHSDSILSATGSTTSSERCARRLLSAEDLDELNVKLEQLFIDSRSSHQADQENEEQQQDKTIDPTTTTSSTLGRFETTVFSYKTCTTSSVMRSARFQE